jgi:hypothetical protein
MYDDAMDGDDGDVTIPDNDINGKIAQRAVIGFLAWKGLGGDGYPERDGSRLRRSMF